MRHGSRELPMYNCMIGEMKEGCDRLKPVAALRWDPSASGVAGECKLQNIWKQNNAMVGGTAAVLFNGVADMRTRACWGLVRLVHPINSCIKRVRQNNGL